MLSVELDFKALAIEIDDLGSFLNISKSLLP